jgi:hypothetical protein
MTTLIFLTGLILGTPAQSYADYNAQPTTPVKNAGAKKGHPGKGHRVPTNPCPQEFPSIDSSCQQICEACYKANYVVGEWGVGDGFWADCVEPLVMNKPAPKHPTNDGRELPSLPTGLESVAAQCKAKSGTFWKKK